MKQHVIAKQLLRTIIDAYYGIVDTSDLMEAQLQTRGVKPPLATSIACF